MIEKFTVNVNFRKKKIRKRKKEKMKLITGGITLHGEPVLANIFDVFTS